MQKWSVMFLVYDLSIALTLCFKLTSFIRWYLTLSLTTTTTVLRPFVRDYPGEPIPEETLTYPPSWSTSNLCQLLPSTMIHSILLVQITCLAIFLHNRLGSFHVFFGLPLGLEPSISYSIHFFTQSVSSFRSTCPYHHSLFCCSINIISSIPSRSHNSLLGTLSFTLTLHLHLTILLSARHCSKGRKLVKYIM